MHTAYDYLKNAFSTEAKQKLREREQENEKTIPVATSPAEDMGGG